MAEEAVVVRETPELNPRNRAFAEIAQKANEHADSEGTQLADDYEGKSARGEDYVAQPEQDKKSETPEMVTIKIDGTEVQVTKDQAVEAGIRALQKDRTADQRLTEATRLLNEAKATTKPPPAEPEKPADAADTELFQLIQDAPFNDEAARKLALRLKGTPPATPKLEDLAPTIERLVDVRLQGREALTAFKTDFQDVVSDPHLLTIFNSEESRLVQSGDTRPPLERWKEIGEGLRKWRGTTATQTTLEDKAKRKETITNLPAANAKPAVQEEPKPKTASQTVEEIRRARGQRI